MQMRYRLPGIAQAGNTFADELSPLSSSAENMREMGYFILPVAQAGGMDAANLARM